MARKPAVELAKEWFDAAETGDAGGMAELLADDAVFYASRLRGRRFEGREEIERFLSDTGFEASGYTYTAVDGDYAVVTLSLRRHLAGGGLADSTLAMVFKVEGDEIVCMDAFTTEHAALASVRDDVKS
jgi:ketosteroid isomerase-like protein